MMRNTRLITAMLIAILCAPVPSVAAEKAIDARDADLAALPGKSLAVVTHTSPAFQPTQEEFNAFKRFFSGDRFDQQYRASFARAHDIDDPAKMLSEQLSKLLVDASGMHVVEGRDDGATKIKPDLIAAQNTHADYVLSIQSLNWFYIHVYAADNSYPLAYVVRMQVIDTRTRKPIAADVCGQSTISSVMRPSQAQWLANGARLTKDTLRSLAWDCFQRFSRKRLRVPPRKIPVAPAVTTLSSPKTTGATPIARF